MNNHVRGLAATAAVAMMLAVSVPGTAEATHKIGHLAAGVGIGLLLGGALANPGYAAPAPVYVQPAPIYVQPSCYWQKQRMWDPYVGAYVMRSVQVCQ